MSPFTLKSIYCALNTTRLFLFTFILNPKESQKSSLPNLARA